MLLPPSASLQPLFPPLSSLEFQPVRKGNSDLWLYGFVDYTDIHETAHQVRFCFRYVVQGGFSPHETNLYVAGPEAYNRFT